MGNNVSAEISTQDEGSQSVTDPLIRPSSRPLSDESAIVVTSPTGARRSRVDARQHLREELFGSSDVGPRSHGVEESHQAYNNHSDAFGIAPSRVITTTTPVTVDTAILILKELKKTASPDDILSLQMALLPTGRSGGKRRSNAVVKYKSETVGPAAAALIRRRSLFTPGLATRTSKGHLLQHSSSARSSVPDSSMESRRPGDPNNAPIESSVEIQHERTSAHHSLTRAETPSVCGQTYLGTHGIGSLRVTNGAVSPEPSIYSILHKRQYPTPLSTKDDEYYTASEGTGHRSVEDLSDTSFDLHSHGVEDHTNSLYSMSRYSSRRPSLSIEVLANKPSSISPVEYSTERASNPFSPSSWARSRSNPCAETPNLSYSPNESAQSNDDVSLSDATSGKADLATVSVPLKSCENDVIKPTSTDVDHAERGSRGVTTSKIFQMTPPVDSGYVSDSSMYTLKMFERDTSYSKILDGGANIHRADSRSTASIKEPEQQNISSPCAPSVFDLAAINPRASLTPKQSQFLMESSLNASCTDKNHGLSHHSSLELASGQQGFPTSVSGNNNAECDGARARLTPKKLQKQRPFSERSRSEPLIVQGQSVIDTAPVVPNDVASKHAERMNRMPAMDHLTHTYASIAHSKKELMDEEVSLYNVNLRFPSPAPTTDQERQRTRRRKSGFGPGLIQRRIFKMGSPTMTGSEKNSTHFSYSSNDICGVSDFGTVVSSLGASPYEISRSLTQSRNEKDTHNIMHPHQMTSPPLHSRSHGMDEKAATKFALSRSRDRLSNIDMRNSGSTSIYHKPNDEYQALPGVPQSFEQATGHNCSSHLRSQSTFAVSQASNVRHHSSENRKIDASHVRSQSSSIVDEKLSLAPISASRTRSDFNLFTHDTQMERNYDKANIVTDQGNATMIIKGHDHLFTMRAPRSVNVDTIEERRPKDAAKLWLPTSKPRFYAQPIDQPRDISSFSFSNPTYTFKEASDSVSAKRSKNEFEKLLDSREPTLPTIDLIEIEPPISVQSGPLTIRQRAAMFERPVYGSHDSSGSAQSSKTYPPHLKRSKIPAVFS